MVAQERHVVHASQDAALSGLGEEDHLPVQARERRRWQVLAAEFPGNETGDQRMRGTRRFLVCGGPQPRVPAPAVGERWGGGRPRPPVPLLATRSCQAGWMRRYLMVRSWR